MKTVHCNIEHFLLLSWILTTNARIRMPPPPKKITSLPSVLPTRVAADWCSSDLLNPFMELLFPHRRSSRRSLSNTFRVYPLSFCSLSQKGSFACTIRSTATRISSSSLGRTTQFFISFDVFLELYLLCLLQCLFKVLI